MKKLIYCAAIGTVAFLFGCGSDATSNYMYQNTFDNYSDWGFNHNTLHKGNAHSGDWCLEMDSIRTYGMTFNSMIKDLILKEPKRIKVSAWVYLPSFESQAEIIVSIGEQGKSAVLWAEIKTEEWVEDEEKWVQMIDEINLPENISPNHYLTIFAKCNSKEKVFIDDLSFTFE